MGLQPKDEGKSVEVEKNWAQIVAVLIGSLSGLTEGLFISWTSPFLVALTEDKENYDITEGQAAFFNTIHPIGMLIGCPIFSLLADKIGRKKSFMLTVIPQLLSWLLSAFGKDVYLFYASRFCAGLSTGCYFAVFPIYVGEVSNPSVRGSWGNAVALSVYVGQLAVNIIGNYFGVKGAAYIFMVLPVIFLFLFAMMPESPYFLIMVGKEDEAKNALRFLKRKQNIEKEYEDLKNDVERQISESGTWLDLVKIKSNRRSITAGVFLRFSQLLSGLIVFFQYTQFIFQKSGGNISRLLSTIILLSINVTFTSLASFFIVTRFKRKTLYITSLLSSGIVLYIMGTYLYIDENLNVDLSSFKWIPIAGMVTYMIFACLGITVIPTLMMSELYSASIKAKAMLLLVIVFAGGNLIVNNIFYYINEFLGFYSPFYLFAVCNTLSAVVSFYLIPETKGKTLEEIQQSLKK